jgi:hypothetical protein
VRRHTTQASDGGWTQTSHLITASGLSNLHRRDPRVPYSSERKLRQARPAQGLYLVVSDIEDARKQLVGHGAAVSEVFYAGAPGANFEPDGATDRLSGPEPNHASYSSYATFSDPDGNGWLLQEVTTRLPGRIDPSATVFTSANDLASALRRAAAAHGEHESRIGQRDEDWPDWYAAYIVAEQAGG